MGALAEGVTYYWQMITGDGGGYRLNPATPFNFRIDLGLGAKGAQPRDAVGPASVNLASGNVSVGAASPGFSTVNGTAGLAYAYNSQAPPAFGLTGSYYNDPPGNNHVFPPPGSNAAMVRNDATIDHYWGTQGPGLGVSANNFLVRWTGFITAPAGGSGEYRFTADHDDGMRITVGTAQILNHWSDGAVWNPSEQAAPVTLVAGAPTPITVDYYQNGGAAFATLAVVEPNGHYGQLPPSWLTPDSGVTSPELSAGWTLAPGALSYVSAVLGDRWVGFIDASGAMHTYTWTGSGYAPPPGDDGVVGTDAAGALTLHATDGVDYAFDGAGRLVSATSALDDGGPGSVSALAYTWSVPAPSGTKPRLTTITDTATGRLITLTYGPGPVGAPCVTGTPVDALCRVTYWDTTVTNLTYSNNQLARIEDPGGVVTEFGYSVPAGGRLVSVLSPLAADAVAAPVTGRANDATVRTEVAYDTSPVPRVTSVTLPAPTAGAPRPAHSYTYTSPTETRVSTAGLTQPLGFARKATFVRSPGGGLTVVDTDADGVAATAVYDAGDRMLSATDGAGRRSTVTYDDDATRAQPTGRATNTYGPAPSSCFGTDNRPNGTCTNPPPPHSATTYDSAFDAAPPTALTGLAATYWANRTLALAPATHASVAATAGSLVPADPPTAGLAAGNWSARYSGEVTLNLTGTYTFAAVLTGQARVYVDDRLVVDAWSPHATTTTVTGIAFANAVAGRHRIRVDYATQAGATPGLVLRWTPPGGTNAAIPAANFAPRYSMATASVSDDTTAGVASRKADALYPAMASRLPSDVTVDRGGASIVTTTTYETLGSGYLRPKTRVLGAGAGSTTTYDYYAAGAGATTPCAGAAPNQAMALKTTTGAAPAVGAALVHTFAYDAAGRIVGSAVAGDWTCTAHDARGRVTSVAVPAYGGEPARTFTYNYAVGTAPNANPLVSSVSDGATVITATVDLLGRTVSYTDAWNKTTTTTYNQAGVRHEVARHEWARRKEGQPMALAA